MNWQERYRKWAQRTDLNEFEYASLKQLEQDKHELEDAFSGYLKFGTAGMRAVIGAGTNRMNSYTVRKASQGVSQWLIQAGQTACQQGLVIAYDNRHFSKDFAQQTAQVLAQNNIRVYLFDSMRPTPELSFAVRELDCFAGIMITASHNPPQYNGYKVYNQSGGQISPDQAEKLAGYIQDVDNELDLALMEFDQLKETGWIKLIGSDVDQTYLQALESVQINPELVEEQAEKLSIVFTPLHGAANEIGPAALSQMGFNNLHFVDEQMEADPDFKTVSSPNPEEAAAFDLAIKKAKDLQADLILATDPDADRLGMACLTSEGEYELFSGNQMAALMIDYILQAKSQRHDLDPKSRLVTSVVSSDLPATIAKSYGIETDRVLTGFKFIADKINEYEKSGEARFLFGFEESYGYLIQDFVRDKDAIQALILIAEMALAHKSQSLTLHDRLLELYEDYGYYLEQTLSVKKEGLEGAAQIEQLMAHLRSQPPRSFAGLDVISYQDYQSLESVQLPSMAKHPLEGPASNVMKFFLEGGSWIAFRPSGTEPKVKAYLGVRADELELAQEKQLQLRQACQQWLDKKS